jgi:CheY-like chemotaxis protein
VARSNSYHTESALHAAGYKGIITKPIKLSQIYHCLQNENGHASTEPKQSHQSTNIDVLVAEDNEINQIVIRKTLESLGFSVDIAPNGSDAINALCKKQYQCLFLDLQMPVMDGLEAARIIRDITSPVLNHDMPVIAMTASSAQSDRADCMEAGMDFCVTKPVRRETLLEIIGLALKKNNTNKTGIPAAAILDTTELFETLDRNDEVCAEILSQFLHLAPSLISDLITALDNRDIIVIKHAAHSLKGSCLNIGAAELAAAAVSAELTDNNTAEKEFSRLAKAVTSGYKNLQKEIEKQLARMHPTQTEVVA